VAIANNRGIILLPVLVKPAEGEIQNPDIEFGREKEFLRLRIEDGVASRR
jgi:hypothetical protein